MDNNSTMIVSAKATSLENSLVDSKWKDEHAELIKKLESAYEPPSENAEQELDNRRYCLQIAGMNLIIDKETHCELLEESNIFSLPLSENWLVGMTNVRGDIVPVIDIEQILNKEEEKNSSNLNNSKVIVIDKAENALGLLINNLPKSLIFNDDEIITDFSDLPDSLQAYALYGYKKNNENWICIDLSSFLQSLKT